MPRIKLVFLWHMHQPFYKDLVTGEYRLPWVRLHALKDYYGMVKLLDEFPRVHQTFNLVPSLLAQLEDYVSGEAKDPFWEVAIVRAESLTEGQKRFALTYLFQANLTHLIGRFPRYRELFDAHAENDFNVDVTAQRFTPQDFRDLQVLSQLAWFDEFLFERPEPELQRILAKGRDFSPFDQQWMNERQKALIGSVIPTYKSAAERGLIEISASPYYHPILPLLCDTDIGGVSSPGLPLPSDRFRYPQDAKTQLERGIALHEQLFGKKPEGVWPSEGSVSADALNITAGLGVRWMATDEGVLGRSTHTYFQRNDHGILTAESARRLYNVYRYETPSGPIHLLFRDHSLSDLIGFVYSGMPAQDAAEHFVGRIRACAQPVLDSGRDAIVPVILDGENAWEFFPRSGREFLRTLYSLIDMAEDIDCVTISEAIASAQHIEPLSELVPGSWINSNFNVWIGAPEDNKAWDQLSAARRAFDQHSASVALDKRDLAFEELLIAEGSDWNWWYGPEHSTANDRDFDELYRKHLSNVYVALGQTPPAELARPILRFEHRARFVPQSAYIRPQIREGAGFFDWIGAGHYRRDRHDAAMHGKSFIFDSMYAGIDEDHLYVRIDFAPEVLDEDEQTLRGELELNLAIELHGADGSVKAEETLRAVIQDGSVQLLESPQGSQANVARGFLASVPLDTLNARIGDVIHLRAAVWQNKLPVDALPAEGSVIVPVVTEEKLESQAVGEYWSA
jgi:alpha-amylase/alpha-mannosidase (GH57 family)